jgi:hypothetical protein
MYGKQKMGPKCSEWHHRLKDAHESLEDAQNTDSGLQAFIVENF